MSTFGWPQWLDMFNHFLTLSLLAVGGAITTVPDMHRYLVGERAWISDEQFTASISLAQAAPGPNTLFVALLGWSVGINAGGGLGHGLWPYAVALMGATLSMVAILLPSSTLTYVATRWAQRNRDKIGVKAFKQGMAPIVVALLIATGWVLTAAHDNWRTDAGLWGLTLVTTGVVWKTRVHMLWLLGAGAFLGIVGWV